MVLISQIKLLVCLALAMIKVHSEANFHEENINLSIVQNAEEAGKLCLRDVDKCMDKDLKYQFTADNLETASSFDVGEIEGVSIVQNAEKAGKLCLRDVKNCMDEDSKYQPTADQLSAFFFGTAPPFDVGAVEGVSPLCKNQSTRYVEDLKKFKLWALKMYDSSAKLPSGILNGNVNQFGDFDLCMQSGEELHEIQGQYCLTSIQVEYLGSSPYISALLRLAHSNYPIKTQLDDIPQLSIMKWALCVPSGCSSTDVELGLNAIVDRITINTDFQVKVKVDPYMCSSSHTTQIPVPSLIILCVFTGFVVLVVLATRYDYNVVSAKNQWILAFSLRKNTNSLMSLKKSQDDIGAIHGARFLNVLLILILHKALAMQFLPHVNRTEMLKHLQPYSDPFQGGSRYIDSFLLFSATLTAYSFLKKLNKNGKINIFEEYVCRLFRIWPALAVLTTFCVLDISWLQSGPMWKQIVTQHSDLCRKYWWRNLLFIQNYYGFDQMCLPHSHHVGTDMQLFAVSPLFVWLLWKWPKKGVFILGFLAFVSTVMRYYVTYTMGLSDYVHFGLSSQQLLETGDNTYILPTHRATVYIMGIILGYILRNFKNTALTKNQTRFGSCLAFLSLIIFFSVTSAMKNVDYAYNPAHAAWYAALSPILWCFPFAWIIFTAHIGHKGSLQRFFSWPPFAIWTNISYSVYLLQIPIFIYSVGITRTSQYYRLSQVFFMPELFPVLLSAVLLTLLVEMPFQNIRDVIFRKRALHGKSD